MTFGMPNDGGTWQCAQPISATSPTPSIKSDFPRFSFACEFVKFCANNRSPPPGGFRRAVELRIKRNHRPHKLRNRFGNPRRW